MIRKFVREFLRPNREQQIPEPAEWDAPREELADGVVPIPQTFNQEAYPPVARPPPSSANGSRDLEDVSTEELWAAIREGAKNLIILSDEIKRRSRDERSEKMLELLGIHNLVPTDSPASASQA